MNEGDENINFWWQRPTEDRSTKQINIKIEKTTILLDRLTNQIVMYACTAGSISLSLVNLITDISDWALQQTDSLSHNAIYYNVIIRPQLMLMGFD